MANTYVQQRIHLVWATLNRQDFLLSPYRDALFSYIGGIIRHNHGVLFAAGGTENHIHVYAEYPKTLALVRFVNVIKSNSSKWLRESQPALSAFHWQRGYAGFSVQRRNDERLREYILNQEEHHRTLTFQDEYLLLLERHGMALDSPYVFD